MRHERRVCRHCRGNRPLRVNYTGRRSAAPKADLVARSSYLGAGLADEELQVDALVGLRVQEEEEVLGLDTSQHGEVAYQL